MSHEVLDHLTWRCIGPHRGGRVVAVAGHARQPTVFYFGSTGGGVWKTTDGGQYWQNVSDGFFKRASVGALDVAPADPNVIYAGMGEATIRGNVSHGDGVYRSTDAGTTWQHLGLEQTRNIGKLRVHPQHPDTVYVAALGHAHGANPERGVFRSTDGGRSWERVLFRDEDSGAIDVSIDPHNPRIIYAAIWQARRGPHYLESGGPGSGLFRSRDGGTSWEELSERPGMPQGPLGKIGVVASPAQAGRVYAIVEAAEGGVFRSNDGGESWQRLCEDRNLRQRAWYYSHIYADPLDPDTVWVLNVETWRSIDAGKTFEKVPVPHGDNHDLWFDPNDSRRLIIGNDGGATISYDGGRAWSSQYNQPTSEFYHVTTDTRRPYRVYGAQQDNTTICVPSRSDHGVITPSEWYVVGGGESGYIAVRPDDPDIVFAGNYQGWLTRYDHKSHQVRLISVWPEAYGGHPAADYKYRFNWTSPTIISPHNPNVLYTGGNHVFRSVNEGQSWQAISPDLSRADPVTLGPSGGPITKDLTGAEAYATVFTLAESLVEAGLLWAGSDDGLVHISRDGGENWRNVTPEDLPEWALISLIEASPHDPAVAYLAATRYKLDDFRPFLYKTSDYGRSWSLITNGIPDDDFTRVIREDPQRAGLLYAGTETGLYVSFNDGDSWQRLGGNLPVVPIHDLLLKDDDLVLATHGRSFWILDDAGLISQCAETSPDAQPRLFQPRDVIRYGTTPSFGHKPVPGINYSFANGLNPAYSFKIKPDGESERWELVSGSNPPAGLIINYLLPQAGAQPMTLTIVDDEGKAVRTLRRKSDDPKDREDEDAKLPAATGLNRFVWNLRHSASIKVEQGSGDKEAKIAPSAAPGTYRLTLQIGEWSASCQFRILKDPRVAAGDSDLAEQNALMLQLRDKLSATHGAVNRIRKLYERLDYWQQQAGEQLDATATALRKKLAAVEGELLQVQARSMQDTLNFPVKLNSKLAILALTVEMAEVAPTHQQYELFKELSTRVDAQLKQLEEIIAEDVAAFNRQLAGLAMPALPATGAAQ